MKTKLTIFIFVLTLNNLFSKSNDPILVTENTIILNFQETKSLFFSFAEGDEIIFDLKMVKGKHIKEVEISEEPNNSLFTEFKVKNIINKRIKIKNKGIYKFRFYSSSLTRRVCKIIVKRIPSSEKTAKFNTNWKWKTLIDTTYIPYLKDSITGYKKINYTEKVRELVKTEIKEDVLFNKNQRVHSFYNENPSKTYLRVDIPSPLTSESKEEKIIAWAYWIGVGQEAREAYKKNVSSIGSFAKEAASIYASPIASLAAGTITELLIPKVGEDVAYYFINDFENIEAFLKDQQFYLFDSGKGIAAYGKNTNKLNGTFYIGLHNDNKLQGIDVDVKVVAIKEVKTYENKLYQRIKEIPTTVILNKKRLQINKRKIRIPVE